MRKKKDLKALTHPVLDFFHGTSQTNADISEQDNSPTSSPSGSHSIPLIGQ